jgi:hypothetical protein
MVLCLQHRDTVYLALALNDDTLCVVQICLGRTAGSVKAVGGASGSCSGRGVGAAWE